MTLSKNYPPFSVLISVYKNEKPEYLDIALSSVENQTIRPNEIVIVEDGPISTSLKKVILKHQKYFGDGFKDIISKKNRGLGAALRLGINYVSTEWVARMDSDDYSVSDRFEKQLKIIKQEPDLAVIGGQVKEFSENINNIIGVRNVPTTSELIFKFCKWRSPFNHPTVMLNKKKILSVGGYSSFGNLEDYYLWINVISNGLKVRNLDSYLTYMRVDEGMYSRRGNLKNVIYLYKLRNYLYNHKMINRFEELIGDVVSTVNIILPTSIRKQLYREFLHKER